MEPLPPPRAELSDQDDDETRKRPRLHAALKQHILDYCPGVRPSFGAVSPDVLGKATTMLLFERIKECDQFANNAIECNMYFKQSHTGCDGMVKVDGKEYRLEVKWSTIQMQTNTNSSSSSRTNYHRFEFGNIHNAKFDLLLLFGHHALQAGALDADVQLCIANVDKRIVWTPSPDALDDWLKSCWVWVYSSHSEIPSTHHCNAFYTRGPYGDTGLWSHKVWGGKIDVIGTRLLNEVKKLTQ